MHPHRSLLAFVLLLTTQIERGEATTALPSSSSCQWEGPALEWVLDRKLPAGLVSGALHADVLPYLRRQGIPVSFFAADTGNERVRLDLGSGATMRDALQAIVRQVPRYRYASIEGRVVLYPQGTMYEQVIDLGAPKTMTRAAAYFYVLRGLREKAKSFQSFQVGLSGASGGWGKSPFADMIVVGGRKPPIDHLLSLVQMRPSESCDVTAMENGRLSFSFVNVSLLLGLELHVPQRVRVGERFDVEVDGRLADGSVVALVGPECGVALATTDPQAIALDGTGHAVARKKGKWRIVANYEQLPDVQASVEAE